MILPIEYLWSQFDGPQVRAICGAIEEFLTGLFDAKIIYLDKLSVETADSEHLDLLGTLAGFIRPTITEADHYTFFFTEHADHNFDNGFGTLEDPSLGGHFSEAGVGQGNQYQPLSTEHYRALLRAFTQGENHGELGSLALLDDICYELTKLDIPGVDPFYSFHFEDTTTVTRADGDVYVDMGKASKWHNPLHIYAVLRGLADTVYAPLPKLFISLNPTE